MVVGGNETLFVRSAYYIAQRNPQTTIYLADYKDGAMLSLIAQYKKRPTNIKIVLVENDKKTNLPDDTLIILASHLIRIAYGKNLPRLFASSHHKLLFWTIDVSGFMGLYKYGHPLLIKYGYNTSLKILPLTWLLMPLTHLRIKNAYKQLIEKKSLIAMSETVQQKSQTLMGVKGSPIVPIIVDRHGTKIKSFLQPLPNKIVWVGRFEGAKYWTLENLLFQLKNYINLTGHKPEVHIIGEGKNEKLILKQLDDLPTRTIFYGRKTGKELEDILLETDILFGCGTAVIEGLKLAIPSVLVAAEFQKMRFTNIGYFCVSSSNGEIGNFTVKNHDKTGNKNYTLNDLFDEYNNNYQSLSKKALKVYEENFSPEAVIETLEDNIAKSSIRINDLEQKNIYRESYLEKLYPFIKKIFSLRTSNHTNSNKVTILTILPEGGCWHNIEQTSKYLTSNGFEIDKICLMASNHNNTDDSTRILSLRAKNKNRLLRGVIIFYKLLKLFILEKPKFVLVYSMPLAVIITMINKAVFWEKPKIVIITDTHLTNHLNFINSNNRPLFFKILSKIIHNPSLYKWAIKHSSYVITHSENMTEDTIKNYNLPKEKAITIPAFIDQKYFKTDLPTQRPKNNFIFVGRLSWEKNIESILLAIQKIKRKNENIKLTIIGDGNLSSTLHRLSENLGLSENVTFVPNANKIEDLHHTATALVLPSFFEGFSLAAAEALANGLPIIAYDTSAGPVDFCKDGKNGYIVPFKDNNAFVYAMEMAIDKNWDPQAIRNTVSFLHPQKVGKAYSDFIEEFISKA